MSTVKDLGAVSAYALAVKYGYVGTEEEWVNEQEAKRKQAVEAASSAAINAATATQAASEAKRAAENAMSDKDAATQSAAEAKTYAENAEAITGIEIAKKNRAGIVKGGDIYIAEDGTIELTRITTDRELKNSYPGGLKINSIAGAPTEQGSTTGAQLFDKDNVTIELGGINVSGENYSFDGSIRTKSIPISGGKDIVVSCDLPIYRVALYSSNDGSGFISNTTSNSGTDRMNVTLPSEATRIRIVCLNTDTLTDANTQTMLNTLMVNYGTEVLPWEPYTGGKPSPSTEYLQEIKKTVVKKLKVIGKNGLDCRGLVEGTKSGVTFSPIYDKNGGLQYINVNGIATETINYTLNSKWDIYGEDEYYLISIGIPLDTTKFNIQLTNMSNRSIYLSNSNKFNITEFSADQYSTRMVLRIVNGAVLNNMKFYPMIRKAGIEDDTYEPYTEKEIELSEAIELYNIGGVADRIVKSDGVNEVERKFTEVVFDGSDDEIISYFNVGENCVDVDYDVEKYDINNYSARTLLALSNRFIYAESGQTVGTFRHSTIDNNGWNGCSRLRFRLPLELNTKDLVKEYFASNPTKVIHESKDPTFEPLPTADQIALRSLPTYAAVTYVSTDSELEPIIEVEHGTSRVGAYTLECCNDREILELENDDLQSSVSDLMSYVGYTDETIYGVEVDFTNKKFTRLAGAAELSAGSDFDSIAMFGGRRRCNVADDGTVNAYYGDTAYAEDGSNGQVMVEQPKFYYKVVPLELEKIQSGKGYHMRKVRYYVSETPRKGFKLHPAFIRNGVENDFIYLSAYEGCTYDTSASAYKLDDAQDVDWTNDVLASIANAKPTSGLTQSGATRNGFRTIAAKRGSGWSQQTIQSVAATQILFLVEYASFNIQEKLGAGVTTKTDDGATSMTEITGATTTLGNKSGQVINTNGYSVVAYRGEENPFGNLWKWVDGINTNNGSTFAAGDTGTIYVADHGFKDNSGDAPYHEVGFSSVYLTWSYISAFGYAEDDDWLFYPTEGKGNSSLPVGDCGQVLNTGWRVAILGANWDSGSHSGLFSLGVNIGSGIRYRDVGGRLLYVPEGTV